MSRVRHTHPRCRAPSSCKANRWPLSSSFYEPGPVAGTQASPSQHLVGSGLAPAVMGNDAQEGEVEPRSYTARSVLQGETPARGGCWEGPWEEAVERVSG